MRIPHFCSVYFFVIGLLNILDFNLIFTIILVLAMAISFFSEYYFGLFNSILISADQKIYVVYITKMITVVINTIACYVLINLGSPVQLIKLTTSLIYLLRPLVYYLYVKKNYNLISIKPNGDELSQRWNAFIQHMTAFVVANIDVIILTIFSTLENISIYAVYYMIIKALQELIISATSGVKSFYGHVIAKNDENLLSSSYKKFTTLITSLSTVIFVVAMTTILPFVFIYTDGVEDVNYIQPTFAVFAMIGQIIYIYRYNFNLIIVSAGHYKQTQLSALIEAVINILISCVSVYYFGLIGVTFGTIIAMSYRCIYFSIYISKKLVKKAYVTFVKQMIISLIIMTICGCYTLTQTYFVDNYFQWVIFAMKNSIIILIVFILLEIIFNYKWIFSYVKNKLLSY